MCNKPDFKKTKLKKGHLDL